MKRVCTLRKVLRSFFKGPLRKVILLFLYIVWFFMTTKFLFLYVVAFIATQFLSSLKYLQPGDMLWNGKVTPNTCMRKSFSRFYCHICHTYTNLLVYNNLVVTTAPISIVTLLSPIATP